MGFVLVKIIHGLAAVLIFLFIGWAIIKFLTVLLKGITTKEKK